MIEVAKLHDYNGLQFKLLLAIKNEPTLTQVSAIQHVISCVAHMKSVCRTAFEVEENADIIFAHFGRIISAEMAS